MFRPNDSLTVDNAVAVLEAGLGAIASGQGEVDLVQLATVDSAAVSVLLAWQRAARAKGIELRLQNMPANLESLLDLYGVSELLPQ